MVRAEHGDTAYVAFNASVYTIDLDQRGNLKRTAPSNDKDLRGHTFFHAPVILDEETLLVGSYKNKLYTIDASSGQATEFFTSARNRWIATPLISDDTIWMCTTCYECQERCPRGIKIVDIVKIIRNQAAQAGFMAPAHKMTGSFVIKTGHGVPINDATMALRKSVGLDELPPTTHQFPEALEEVQKIFKATGFDNLIGYNWETGELE